MRIGILGGGQLAQMLALAGIPLGIRFVCLESQRDCPAACVAQIIPHEYSQEAVHQLANLVDVVTFESENIPLYALKNLSVPFYPPIKALEIGQDRLLEKQFFKDLGINVTEFLAIDNRDDLQAAIHKLGLPLLLKTRRQGYDGKGQRRIHSIQEADSAYEALSASSLIAEKWVHFDQEVSLIAVRNRSGQINFYPLTENTHQDGILRISKAPFLNDDLTFIAQNYLRAILEALGYVGILAVEFFVKDNTLIVNEMAPRVHNSGHWTIEGAKTNQFENHLRAILNLPLGETSALGYSLMANFIGEFPPLNSLLRVPSLHVHAYGKTPRPGRKLGHATLQSKNPISMQNATFLLSLIEKP